MSKYYKIQYLSINSNEYNSKSFELNSIIHLKSVFPRSCPSHRILTVIVTFFSITLL